MSFNQNDRKVWVMRCVLKIKMKIKWFQKAYVSLWKIEFDILLRDDWGRVYIFGEWYYVR